MTLTVPSHRETARGCFDPASVSGLPAPARRWLRHAISPGTPLATGMDLRMHGAIRVGRWRIFTASEVIVPGSTFTWAARTTMGRLPLTGFDRYADGVGEMRWRLAGLVPVQSASGFDVSLSAFERMAAESVLVPSALVGAAWSEGAAEGSAVYSQRWGERAHWTRATVHVDAADRLSSVSLWRWGDPSATGHYGLHRFEVTLTGELRCDVGPLGSAGGASGEMLIPRGLRAAWVGADGEREEFFRAVIDAAFPILPGR